MGYLSMADTADNSPPPRWKMEDRLNLFLEDYARACEARHDPRHKHVKYVGIVPIADAIRMLKEVPNPKMY